MFGSVGGVGFFDGRLSDADDVEDDAELDDAQGIYLGGVVPVEVLIARSESAAVAVQRLVGFPDGFELSVHAWVRAPVRRPGWGPTGVRS